MTESLERKLVSMIRRECHKDDFGYYVITTSPEAVAKLIIEIVNMTLKAESEAPSALRTERMGLHDELDQRFPFIDDFKAFVRKKL